MDAPTDPNDASPPFLSHDVQRPERSTCSKGTIDHKECWSIINDEGTQLNQLMNLALHFLSTCSNETLLLVLACLVGATYIILGRLGLLLIGATLGAALHASWDGGVNNHLSKTQHPAKKQLSLSIVHKLLDWERSKSVETGENHYDAREPTKEGASDAVDISAVGPITATVLHSLIDAAMRDYVNHWYEPLIPNESTFPTSCRGVLTSFVASIASHLCRKRAVDTFLEFLTNSSSIIIVFLSELCVAFETAGSTVTAEDAVLQYLESNPDSSLSSLLAHQQQHQKLVTISDDILSRFLDSDAYNCIPVRNFLREVLTGIAFESTITSMSRPEVINGWITYIFSEGESEIMSAIDAGVEGARNHGVATVEISGEKSFPTSTSTRENVTEGNPSPGQARNKVDRATEDAMLETKRLSAMIAAQNIPEYSEKTIQDEVCEERNTGDRDNTDVPTGAGSPLGEQLDMKGTEQVQYAQVIKSSGLGDSLTSPSLQPGEVSAGSFMGSTDASSTFSLYRALITVDDGCDSGDKAVLRSKPTLDYLIQVEPHSERSGGWMVFKKYADFEAIHETLLTIARLNQLIFKDSHPLVPPWKGRTRQALGRDLERYLQEAVQLGPLADSVTMRRFLEKDGGLSAEAADPSLKPGFLFPGQAAFENVGKGVLGVLTHAPRGVSGSGKAVLDGVTGVFGGSLNRKLPSGRGAGGDDKGGHSVPQKYAPLLKEGSQQDIERFKVSNDTTSGELPSQLLELSNTGGLASPSESASLTEPSDTPVPTPESERNSADEAEGRVLFSSASAIESKVTSTSFLEGENDTNDNTLMGNRKSTDLQARLESGSSPITEDETRMAVELIFALINELYSLSSAWNIRRTLLNAAKSYILRPGNPNLETVRGLLQESMIDCYTNDDALGAYLAKLRKNVLPTAEELKSWPPAQSDAEKERQREAARRTLVQKGLPQAITSVMGAAATREALGRVFDSLQVDIVARGFVFAVLLQALRAMIL
ncbi:PX domain protein [Aspergillus mulundensis]|uniref:PXA domain-containing protein n=1 Tax=Aspergillus mulundensis TaxID=1810919 RepID=A0A3D8SXA2_9EURO|nr:hypothetical protein DSM5745_02675 [Aspergillus mulundensis]RDW90900.1 hypothetical protein DSM5745_02675 [Aspergillus mulundensis]